MFLRRAASVLMLLGLAACATPTPYAPAGSYGYGYGAQQIEDNRFRVYFRGNSLTTLRTVQNYLLYHAAELTLQQGGDHFVVVRRDIDADTRWYSRYDGPPYWPGSYWGGYPYGWGYPSMLWHDRTAEPVTRYEAHAEIVVRRGPKPDDPAAFDARSVIRNLAPEIRTPADPPSG